MKNTQDIENLFRLARVPELRPGLKEKVMSAAGRGPDRAQTIAHKLFRRALVVAAAACLLLAFMFNLWARAHDRRSFVSPGVPSGAVSDTDRLRAEFSLHAMSAARHEVVYAEIFARNARIEMLLKGEHNGS